MQKVLQLKVLGLTLLAAVAIAACQRTPNQYSAPSVHTDCQTVEHIMGEAEVCGQPENIVVLGSSMLESILALEVQPVAYADYLASMTGEYTDPSRQIPYLGDLITGQIVNLGFAGQPEIEAIVKVQPDLILGSEFNANQYETLSQIAPTLLLTWADTEANLNTITQVVGKSENVEPLLVEWNQRITTARDNFAPVVASHPKVLMLRSNNLQEIYFGNQLFGACASLVRELGFELVSLPSFDEPNSDAPTVISVETLSQFNEADLILMLGTDFNQADQIKGIDDFEDRQLSPLKQAWAENSIAQSLDASKAGRVYFIPYVLCAGLPGPIGTELYLAELKAQLLSSN
ncbi:MAG: iron-siderophore ABC transporter substrate-binding protein [Cyanobacteria bacterium P01_A01_bin.123]